MSTKPVVKLSGTDGNIFALVSLADAALKQAGLKAEAAKMRSEVFASGSYDQALYIIQSYVDAE